MSFPTTRSRNVRRWIVTMGLLVLLLAGIGWLVGLVLTQTALLQSAAQSSLRRAMNMEVNIGHTAFEWLPLPQVRFADVTVRTLVPQHLVFAASSVELALSLTSLFRDPIEVARLEITGPRMWLRRDRAGRWIGLPPETPTTPPHGAIDRLAAIKELVISDGRMTVIAEDPSGDHRTILLDTLTIRVSPGNRGESPSVGLSARLPTRPAGASLSFAGQLHPPDGVPDASTAKDAPKRSRSAELVGQLTATNIDVTALRTLLAGSPIEDRLPMLDAFQATIALTATQGSYTIALPRIEATIGPVSLTAQGHLRDIAADSPATHFTLAAAPLTLRELFPLLPSAWIPADLRAEVMEQRMGATLEAVEATISNDPSRHRELAVTGTVHVRDGTAFLGIGHTPFTHIAASLTFENRFVEIAEVRARYLDSTVVNGTGMVELRDAGPWIDFTGVAEATAPDAFASVPPEWQASFRRVFSMDGLAGTANLTARFVGPLADPARITMPSMDIVATDLHLPLVKIPHAIRRLGGEVHVTDTGIRFENVRGVFRSSTLTRGRGTVRFHDQPPEIDVTGDFDVSLPDVVVLAQTHAPGSGPLDFISTWKDTHGRGRLSLHARGPLDERSGRHIVSATLEVNDVALRLPDEAYRIERVSGRARMERATITIERFRASRHLSHVQSDHAMIRLDEAGPWGDVQATVDLAAQDIGSLLRRVPGHSPVVGAIAQWQWTDGQARLTLHVQGPLDDSSKLNVVQATFQAPALGFRASADALDSGRVAGHVRYREPRLQFRHVTFALGRSRVIANGDILLDAQQHREQAFTIEGRVFPQDVFGLLPRRHASHEAVAGPIDVLARFSGPFDHSHGVMAVDLSGAGVELPGIFSKQSGVRATVLLEGDLSQNRVLSVDRLDLPMPPLRLVGQGAYVRGDAPEITATMTSGQVPLEQFPEGVRIQSHRFTQGTMDLSFGVHGRGKDWHGWEINAVALLSNGVVKGSLPNDPHLTIGVQADLTPPWLNTKFQIASYALDDLWKILDVSTPRVGGFVSATGGIHVDVSPPIGSTRASRGNVNVVITRGEILRSPIIHGILNILNVPSLLQGKVDLLGTGLPFDSLTGTVSIVDGRACSNDIVLDGPIVKMAAAGSYIIDSGEVDLVVAVSPLGSYADILKRVPLFGRLLAGTRQGLDTALFKVSGTRLDPNIRYLPVDSFTTGIRGLGHLVVDVLNNAVQMARQGPMTERVTSLPSTGCP